MLSKAMKSITTISENSEINSSNYFEALSFLDDVYLFLNKIKTVFNNSELTFSPSFIGEKTAEHFNLELNAPESEMKVFKFTSSLFSEDNIESYKETISEKLGDDIEKIEVKDNLYIEIILK